MGGIVPDVRDESILSRCNDRRQLAEVSRDLYSEWGGMGSIDDTVLGKPSHDNEVSRRLNSGDYSTRGGYS